MEQESTRGGKERELGRRWRREKGERNRENVGKEIERVG